MIIFLFFILGLDPDPRQIIPDSGKSSGSRKKFRIQLDPESHLGSKYCKKIFKIKPVTSLSAAAEKYTFEQTFCAYRLGLCSGEW